MKNLRADPYLTVELNRGGYQVNSNARSVASYVKPLFQRVPDVLQARKAILQFIEQYQLSGSAFTGGTVRDKKGKLVAEISYNGRIWLNRQKYIPYPPQVCFQPATRSLLVLYSFFYKELKLTTLELHNSCMRMIDPVNDNQGLEFSIRVLNGELHWQFMATRFEVGSGWQVCNKVPLMEGKISACAKKTNTIRP